MFAAAFIVLAACAAPTERGDINERLSHWNTDVKRFLHMHSAEAELRNWLDERNIEYSNPNQGPGFVALLESVSEAGQTCPTDIVLVGQVKDARVLWFRVEAMQRPDCDGSLST